MRLRRLIYNLAEINEDEQRQPLSYGVGRAGDRTCVAPPKSQFRALDRNAPFGNFAS